MSIVFTSQQAFTDPALPLLKADPILPDVSGALALFIPALTSDLSVAASGTIQNLAWEQAKLVIPAGTEATLKGVTSKTFSSAASGITEITTKKGIHVINSQTVSAQDQGFMISLADLIKNYIVANSTHKYFMSVWGLTTRVTLDSTNQYSQAGISSISPNSTQLMTFLGALHAPGSASPFTLGTRVSQSYSVLGKYIKNQAVTGFSGGTAPTVGNLLAYLQIGSKDPYKSFDVNKAASGIIYKWYIEDLTVSGRSYADVDAIDNALYTTAFAAGGRYYGDTYTDPATIA